MFTKTFKQLSKYDANIAGGKGASLGEMINAGIPVPDGFVVLSTTFDKFIELTDINIEIDAIISKVKHNEISSVEDASKQIQSLILNADMPKEISQEIETEFKKLNCKYVAVRSSATAEDSASAAWAGQLDSFLNTTSDTLAENVKRCFASLFTPRAIFYRFEKELNEQKISVAVVVQKMVNSKVSGIAFSVHPVTEDHNQIIIEAGFGLGEAIVSGQITPDSYVITKDDLNILDKNVYTQERGIFRDDKKGGNEWKNIFESEAKEQCLSDNQIIELSNLIIRIENHYNFPCDIEWAMEDDTFFIVQSRPITTLKNIEKIEEKEYEQHQRDYSILNTSLTIESYFSEENISYFSYTPSPMFILIKNDILYHFSEKHDSENRINNWIDKYGKLEILKTQKEEHDKYLKQFRDLFNGSDDLEDVIKLKKLIFLMKKLLPLVLVGIELPEFSEKISDKKIVSLSMEIRKESEDVFKIGFDLQNELIENIFESLGLDKSLAGLMTANEIDSFLENKKIPENLKNRKKFVLIRHFLKDEKIFFDEKSLEEFKLIKRIENKNDINGKVAYPGIISGFVRIVKSVKDASSLKDGEILVTAMTDPRYLSIMKKAAAFVTDEGGITCHAAIVAREMKKPCIIGTKIATQVLKDGDEVEVDADNGAVRILNKKSDDESKMNNDVEMLEEAYKKANWDIQKFNAYPFFISSTATISGFNLPWGESYKHFLCITQDNNVSWHYDINDFERLGNIFWNNVSSVDQLRELRKQYYQDYLLAKEEAIYDSNKIKDYPVSELVNLLNKQVNYIAKSAGWAHIVEPATYIGEKKIKEMGFDGKEIHSSEQSFLQKALLFAKEVRIGKNDQEAYNLFLEKYSWIQSSYLGKNIISFDNFIEFSNTNYDTFSYKETGNKVLDILSLLFAWQDERKAHILQSIYESQDVLEVISQKINISLKSLLFMLPEETGEIEKNSYHEELKRREVSFIDYAPFGEKRICKSGSEVRGIIDKLKINKTEGTDEFPGNIAYKGKVRGRVKICLSLQSIDSFKEGDILVASMTRPEYISAIKKSLAIITDEGGITCHAAIISRELKIPCIIGTKIATHILNDGDEVEVDADNGVVRILNKKSSDSIDIKKFKESIKDREYTTQQGDISIAIFGNMCNAIQKEFISVYDYKHVQPILTMQKGTGGICFFDLEMYRDFSRVSYSRIKDSVYNLPEYKNYQELSKIIDDEYNNFSIPKDVAELKKKILNYFILVKKYLVSNLYCEAVDHQIVKELAEKTGVKNIEKFVETSILPTKMSFVGHQNQLLLDGADISWSFANYFAAPTIEDRLELLNKKRKEINKKEVEDEIKKIKQIAENNQKLVVELLKEVSEEQKRVIEFVQASINVRDERKEFILKLYTIISDSLRALAQEYNISYNLISTIAEDEMEKLGDPSFIKVLEERFKKGVAMISGEKSHQISVVDYDLSKNIIFGETGEIDIVNGICANKGFYKGRVRVIVSEKDFSQFQNNEILVTGMTRAEYVPLMRKAGAIITDEGGVTCHAAIVSRELGIPCVIGTKIATQVLKDGDEVEVDADNGIVRMLNKKGMEDDTSFVVQGGSNTTLGNIKNEATAKWTKLVTRKNSIFMDFIKLYGASRIIRNFGWDYSIKNFKIINGVNYYKEDYFDSINLLRERCFKDKNILNEILGSAYQDIDKFKKTWEVIEKTDFKKLSERKLKDFFVEYVESVVGLMTYLLIPLFAEKIITEELEKIIDKNFRQENKDEILSLLSLPKKRSLVQEEQIEFFEMLSSIKKEPQKHKSLVNDHLYKWAWLGDHNFFGDFWTFDDVNKRIELEKNIKSPEAKIEEIIKTEKEQEYLHQQKIKSVNLTKYDLEVINFAREFSYLRAYRLDMLFYSELKVINLLKEVAGRMDVPLVDFFMMTHLEIIDWLSGNKNKLNSEIEKRKKDYAIILQDSNLNVFSGDDIKSFKEVEYTNNQEEEIKGNTAFGGKAVGTVKVISNKDDFNLFKDNDILVAAMTTPDYVPLMKKASAIITDEGGITCHAAIVSRELGIPCVIGTKIATQVLKDGDEVEVDADNGIVRILKVENKINNDIEWIKVFSRKHNLQRMSFLWTYFKTGLVQDKSIKLDNLLVLPNEDRHDYYLNKKEWDSCLNKLSDYLLRDSLSCQKKYFDTLAKKFLNVSKKVYNSDLKKWTDKELSDWFENFLEIYAFYSWYVFTPFALEAKIYPKLLEELNKKYPEKVNEYLEIVSTPTKNNHLLEQQLDLLRISLLKNKDKKLDRHVKKYFWIPVNNINDKPWDKNDFLEQIKEFNNAKLNIKAKKEDLKNRGKEFNCFIKKIKNDRNIYNLSRLINFYVSLRDDSRDVWRESLCYVNSFYIEVARRANLKPEGALNLSNEEIFYFLKSKKIPEDLSTRDEKHAVLFKGGEIKIIIDNSEIEKMQKSLLKDGSELELKGFSAYKGVVSGVVRLIKGKEDLKFLQDGEILVSHHTSPDYLLAMKKAKAFITDEGGVTSHAAIVARELKIPCITAVGNASSILKTGDEVEVDADNGVVRILKRK